MTQKARQLGITPQAVRNRIAAGKINGVRFTGQRWRFEIAEMSPDGRAEDVVVQNPFNDNRP
jgi:hypothetical protein